MPTDNVIPLFPRRESPRARWRRRARATVALATACTIAFVPLAVDAESGAASRLPPGHPPIDTQRLPPGHPSAPDEAGPTCTPGLPQGHPSVNDPRLPPGHPPVELKPCAPGATSNGVYHPDLDTNDAAHVIET